MTWKDVFRSKEQLAEELANHQVAESPIVPKGNTPEEVKLRQEYTEGAKMYHMDVHSKEQLSGYLDAFYRKK